MRLSYSGILRFSHFWLLLLLTTTVLGQDNAEALKQSVPVALDNLIQGPIYSPNYLAEEGTQYLDKNWIKGGVLYLKQTYNGLFFRYDIYTDELIAAYRKKGKIFIIQLNKSFVEGFNLEDRRFLNLEYSRYLETGLEKGYYEILFEGKFSLLVKRRVVTARNTNIQAGESIEIFVQKDNWFLIKNRQPYRIQNKKKLLATIDSDHKKQVSTFMKKQKIRPRKASTTEWLQLMNYLNTLQSN